MTPSSGMRPEGTSAYAPGLSARMRIVLIHVSGALLVVLAGGCGRLGYQTLGRDAGLDAPAMPDAPRVADAPAPRDVGIDVASPPDTGPDARDFDMPLEDFIDRLAPLFCAAIADCNGPRHDDITVDQCVTMVTAKLRSETLPRLRALEALGHFHYDGTFAEACLATYPLDSCETLATGYSHVCVQALQGRVPTGASCGLSIECGELDACVPDGDAMCPTGVCTPRGDVGAMCARQPSFPPDEQCRRGQRCVGGRCAVAVAPGGTCSGLDACGPGLVCSGGTCVDALAAFGGVLGAPCDVSDGRLCRPGLSCSFAGIPTPQCAAAAASRGAACVPGFPDPCPNGQFCLVGTCVDLPAEGTPCLPPEFLLRCQPSLECSPSGNCWGYGADARRCGSDADCGTPRACLGGRCSDPPPCAT